MKTKELQDWTAKWIREKRGRKTLKQFSKEIGIPISTLNKHESNGVLRFDVIIKYIDSNEEMLEIFSKFKT